MAGLQAIKYVRGKLEVLDQLKLPHEFVYDNVETCKEGFDCIRSMRVRGAPAIAIVATLALAVELVKKDFDQITVEEQIQYISARLDYLYLSRPTAVDLTNAIKLLKVTINIAALASPVLNGAPEGQSAFTPSPADIREAYILAAEKILGDDLATNLAIGRYGAEFLRRQQLPVVEPVKPDDELRYFTTSPPGTQGEGDKVYRRLSVLTHCNTGSLATSGHGTALGIIRSLHKMNYLAHAYCTETRPYNQGSRLTAFELAYEKIPATLITDSMAGALFARLKEERNISAVIVGADRVVRNGDTANKIGTYSLAVLAKAHGIAFVVAAPTTSIDLETESGSGIRIEERKGSELTQISGAVVEKDGSIDKSRTARVVTAHQEIDVWNPAFDVTPHNLIDAIITEKGEVTKSADGSFDFEPIMPERWQQQVLKAETHAPKEINGTHQEATTEENLSALSTTLSSETSDEAMQFKMEHI